MDIGRVFVRLGDMNNQLPKENVTPAEIILLRQIHGDESVSFDEQTGEDKRTNLSEYDRLKAIYGETTDGKDKPIMVALWPNRHAAVFPAKFSEVGIDVFGNGDAPKRRRQTPLKSVEDEQSEERERSTKAKPKTAKAPVKTKSTKKVTARA